MVGRICNPSRSLGRICNPSRSPGRITNPSYGPDGLKSVLRTLPILDVKPPCPGIATPRWDIELGDDRAVEHHFPPPENDPVRSGPPNLLDDEFGVFSGCSS